ncbi:MAG: cytochrome C biogenesis protein [Sulfobacillus benefaciens]|uniref:Cytochrome C biogenesis protein n=1 Tax=Sulfobacillus benefaciens TaxID=453960 RepID=A0A2T2XFF4_9FIRM|nr:MAG: cytochrome C biogenesis protein [Sulfobacillus benefaciens]
MSLVSIGVAFVAGLASVLSPCVLPLIPSYLTSMAGTALTPDSIADHKIRSRVIQNSLLFILGFSLILIAAGLGASALGQFVAQHRRLIAELGGLVIIVFGLEISGVIEIGLFKRDAHIGLKPNRRRWSSILLGVVFAAGWTPCVGPILASILILAARSNTVIAGALLLASYAVGLAIPFFALAVFLGQAAQWTRRLGQYLPWIEKLSGAFLVILGVMLITGWFDLIPNWVTAAVNRL